MCNVEMKIWAETAYGRIRRGAPKSGMEKQKWQYINGGSVYFYDRDKDFPPRMDARYWESLTLET